MTDLPPPPRSWPLSRSFWPFLCLALLSNVLAYNAPYRKRMFLYGLATLFVGSLVHWAATNALLRTRLRLAPDIASLLALGLCIALMLLATLLDPGTHRGWEGAPLR